MKREKSHKSSYKLDVLQIYSKILSVDILALNKLEIESPQADLFFRKLRDLFGQIATLCRGEFLRPTSFEFALKTFYPLKKL